MKSKKLRVREDQLVLHPYHEEVYGSSSTDSLELSIKRTGGTPLNPVAVVPHPEPQWNYVISGKLRMEAQINMGLSEIEVTRYEITDETEIRNLIVDLNKQRVKTGSDQLHEFRHFLSMYPPKKGVPGNRYSKIGKEIGKTYNWVKDLVILDGLFEGEGDIILEKIFNNELSVSEGMLIKEVVETQEEKFSSPEIFKKICDPKFDYKRLDYGIKHLNLEDDIEYDLFRSYLRKEIDPKEMEKKLQQMGRIKEIIDNHENSKIAVPSFDDVFTTENTHIIHGNSLEVDFDHPFEKSIRCLVGSAEYGDRRLNRDKIADSPGHHMNGQEYGIFLAGAYVKYKQYLSPDGSIYVILDDFRLDDGSMSCYLEYFVTEMLKNGFYLVGRYIWFKENPMPRSYRDKDMVGGYEMIYRFSLDPQDYYCNTDVFIEREKGENESFQEGCTNSDKKGNITRGSEYYQSHLKKLRNTLDKRECMDIIRGNVCNPETFFHQEEQKKHSSQSPIYLTSTLILESTQPGDLVVDIWNGVGNTMTSALLLGRKYVGIELNKDYYEQTCRRIQLTEERLKGTENGFLSAA